jgi:hypothetical protein
VKSGPETRWPPFLSWRPTFIFIFRRNVKGNIDIPLYLHAPYPKGLMDKESNRSKLQDPAIAGATSDIYEYSVVWGF